MNYECGGPVEGGLVIKRAQEDSLVEHIIARDLYIPICGGRQTGKTTLMYQLRNRLRSSGMGTAYLYLGGMEDDMAAARFYEIICGRIIEDTNTCLTKDAGKPNIQHVLDQAGFQDFIKWLVLRTANCKRLVIMLDEVGGVPSKLATSFWGCLRNMFTQRGLYRKVIFLLAGELDMNHLATANNSPLINVCVSPFIELMDFTIDQVKILVEAGLPESSLFTSAIYYWTDGHPYLTQKLCHLVQQAILHDPQYIDVVRREKRPLTDLIVRYFKEADDPNLIHLFNQLNATEQYRKRVRDILCNGAMPVTPVTKELAVLGIVKLGADRRYGIRNHIYELALGNYFEDFEGGGIAKPVK